MITLVHLLCEFAKSAGGISDSVRIFLRFSTRVGVNCEARNFIEHEHGQTSRQKKLFRPRQHWLLSRNQLAMMAIGTFIVYLRTSNSKFYGLTRIKVQKTIHGSRCFHRFLTADTVHVIMHKLCTSPLLLLIRECSGEMENQEMWVGTQQCGQSMVIYCDLETVIWGEMLKGYWQR